MPRPPLPAVLATAVAIVMAACSAGGGTDTGPNRSGTASRTDGFGHVHGIDLNPADGLVYAATHLGVLRIRPNGRQRVAEHHQDTMGFTIAGPDLLLASGHPAPDQPGPSHLGLIRSTDRAATWTAVSLTGEADFHALSAAGSTVYGFDATDGVVMRSDDGGQSWQHGPRLVATDLDVDPTDPLRVLVTNGQDLLESRDGGMSFTTAVAQPPRPLLLIDHVHHVGGDGTPSVVGVESTGTVWALNGASWDEAGTVPGPPSAFTVIGPDRYLTATDDGVLFSEDAGRTWILIAATSG